MGWRVKAFYFLLISFIYCNSNAGYYSQDAQQCNVAIKYYENKYKIPENLLRSIAIIESGRWDKSAKNYYPWPWAVGIEGKPHFFENKHKAVKFVKEQLHKGIKNIDVGCNQINLMHHGKHFTNIEQAFNPVINTNYAANFLKNHFENTKDWTQAVARYHSFTPHLGEKYASKVLTRWKVFLKEALPVKKAAYKQRPIKQYIKPSTIDTPTKSMSKSNISRSEKLKRSKEGIIVFSRNNLNIDSNQKSNPAIVEISERVLNQY